MAEVGAVVPGVGAGAPIPLHGEDRPRRAHRVGQRNGEQAGAGVEVHHRCPVAVARQGQDGREQRGGGARVHLPEHAVRNAVGAATDGGVHGAGRPPDLPSDHQSGAEVGQAGRRLPARRHRDHRLARLGPRHHLELGGAGPQDRQGAGGGDARAGDGALGDVLEPMGAVAPETHGAAAVHRDAHPAAPTQAGGVTGNRLHLDGPLQSRQALQLFRNAEGLQAALCPEVHVLEVAAATAPGPGVRARGLDAVGGGGQDLDGVGPQVGGGVGRHPGPDPLAGEAVPDEDHLAVGGPGHAAPAGRDGAHLELQEARILGGRHGRGA